MDKKSNWTERVYPDVTTKDGLRNARILGAAAAAYLGFSFFVTVAATIHPDFAKYGLTVESAEDRLFQITIVLMAALLWFFSAYRIAKGKGQIAIWMVLAYAIYSFGTKLVYTSGGPGLFLSFLSAGAALNGVRATLQDRRSKKISADQLMNSPAHVAPSIWRRRSKPLRAWIFLTVFWAIGVLLFVLLFDPYNVGSWSYLDDEEVAHMLGVIAFPPLFFGSLWFGYQRFVV